MSVRVVYCAQIDKDSDNAMPIDAIKTLDTAQSQRLLGLAHLTAKVASIAPIETSMLETPGQRLLAHCGPGDSSIVQSEMCSDLYETPMLMH